MLCVRLSQYCKCVVLNVFTLLFGLSSCDLSLIYEFIPTSLICRSNGRIFVIISREACGVVLSIVVAAVLAILFTLFYCLPYFLRLILCPHIIQPYVIFGLTMPVYVHFISFGLGPYIPLVLLARALISVQPDSSTLLM